MLAVQRTLPFVRVQKKLNMQRKIQINLTQTAAKVPTNSHKSNEKLLQRRCTGVSPSRRGSSSSCII